MNLDWNTLLSPILTDIVKALTSVIALLIIAGLKLLYQKEAHNLLARKFLDWLVKKAIENQLNNPALDNSALWKQLVSDAGKMGIAPDVVANLEAQVMAQVNAWFITRNNPQPVLPIPVVDCGKSSGG